MKRSAGILLYKIDDVQPLYFLVHPGGPFFAKKDKGWWTIPKGEPEPGEELLTCAIREFREETGYSPSGEFIALGEITQKGGKTVSAWLCKGNPDAAAIQCNTFELEWPPRSGKVKAFPEIDKAGWFSYDEATALINERQQPFLDKALALLQA